MATDPDLVKRAQGGDSAALDQLLAQHLPDLQAFLRKHADARILARESHTDVVQSVWGDAIVGIGLFEYRGPNSFRDWLFQVALNKVIDKHRFQAADKRDGSRELPQTEPGGRSPVREAHDAGASPSAAASARESAAQLERALASLPNAYREVILLARFDGLSHEEIAAQLGRTVEASRTLLRRALIQLSGELTGARSTREDGAGAPGESLSAAEPQPTRREGGCMNGSAASREP